MFLILCYAVHAAIMKISVTLYSKGTLMNIILHLLIWCYTDALIQGELQVRQEAN